ncbi:MAG: hypothetical protein ACT4OO_10340 [Nitrospiraceae bacterium]
MSEQPPVAPSWEQTRRRLSEAVPQFYELEPGGSLALELGGDDSWMLEVTPDGRLICQTGMDMEDIQNLLSTGTPEDLGTDELAKQAKYYLQPAVSKYRKVLVGAGFAEATEMNDHYVAVTFQKTVDFRRPEDVQEAVRWCLTQFKRT